MIREVWLETTGSLGFRCRNSKDWYRKSFSAIFTLIYLIYL